MLFFESYWRQEWGGTTIKFQAAVVLVEFFDAVAKDRQHYIIKLIDELLNKFGGEAIYHRNGGYDIPRSAKRLEVNLERPLFQGSDMK